MDIPRSSQPTTQKEPVEFPSFENASTQFVAGIWLLCRVSNVSLDRHFPNWRAGILEAGENRRYRQLRLEYQKTNNKAFLREIRDIDDRCWRNMVEIKNIIQPWAIQFSSEELEVHAYEMMLWWQLEEVGRLSDINILLNSTPLGDPKVSRAVGRISLNNSLISR